LAVKQAAGKAPTPLTPKNHPTQKFGNRGNSPLLRILAERWFWRRFVAWKLDFFCKILLAIRVFGDFGREK
jgi:hypothetical protein